MNQPKKILVGMSGGVDSAVAAFLLQQQGYEVQGGTFILWENADTSALRDARAVCDKLNIPHHSFDFTQIFRKEVMDNFCGEYARGRTPNPCVVCNKTIKFGAFLHKALELGCDFISTGHYARIEQDPASGLYRMRQATDPKKDQSYVLYTLTQQQLSAAILPLADYSKPQIREIARQNNLIVAQKPESQDICFIPDGDYVAFLRAYRQKEPIPGNFVDEKGSILGRHKGIEHYTIGQRKGLGLSFAQPMFVKEIDSAQNTVTLAEENALLQSDLTVHAVNWIIPPACAQFPATVKIRYGAAPAAASIFPLPNNRARVTFATPQRAITKGQSAVFYDGDLLLGGGIIE